MTRNEIRNGIVDTLFEILEAKSDVCEVVTATDIAAEKLVQLTLSKLNLKIKTRDDKDMVINLENYAFNLLERVLDAIIYCPTINVVRETYYNEWN